MAHESVLVDCMDCGKKYSRVYKPLGSLDADNRDGPGFGTCRGCGGRNLVRRERLNVQRRIQKAHDDLRSMGLR